MPEGVDSSPEFIRIPPPCTLPAHALQTRWLIEVSKDGEDRGCSPGNRQPPLAATARRRYTPHGLADRRDGVLCDIPVSANPHQQFQRRHDRRAARVRTASVEGGLPRAGNLALAPKQRKDWHRTTNCRAAARHLSFVADRAHQYPVR